jgi:hypothetical protein
VDHLIVAAAGLYSFAQQGEFTTLAREYQALNLDNS